MRNSIIQYFLHSECPGTLNFLDMNLTKFLSFKKLVLLLQSTLLCSNRTARELPHRGLPQQHQFSIHEEIERKIYRWYAVDYAAQ